MFKVRPDIASAGVRESRESNKSCTSRGFVPITGIISIVLIATVLSACATGAKKGGTPLWAYDLKAVYPDRDWLAAVEQSATRKNAESAAVDALARIFRTDVLGVTNAYMEYAQTITSEKRKKTASLDESRFFAQNVTTTASVSGLIGVVTETAQDDKGIWWANARMNRAECAAVYAKTVRENEKIIADLRADAEQHPGTLDAYADLRFAVIVAQVTDDLQSKLAILDSSAARRGVAYGNTDALRAEAITIARSVLIDVRVSGDDGGRLANALSAYLTKQGFRTGPDGEYTLAATYTAEPVELPNSRGYQYVRYVFQTALRNRTGNDVFAWSENGREGHITEADARQRALRATEDAVSDGNFTQKFEAYLDSLL
ncbi:MAG: hypothetical protein LBK61_02425 [Spirochaetaceae bacterium]|jgi:hypothetical protein|nr:hypothetical protein [Spirochaetaceae bacterium]